MHRANPAAKRRVLILDEDRIIVQSLSQFLRREGYEVSGCDDAREAMNRLEGGPFELFLGDVNMPGLKADEVLRDVRRRWAPIVVIVITGEGAIERVGDTRKVRVVCDFTKPLVGEGI